MLLQPLCDRTLDRKSKLHLVFEVYFFVSMYFIFQFFSPFCTMDVPAVRLGCLEQGNRSLKEFLEDFLDIGHQATFPEDYLCSFLLTGLNITTQAKLSGEGP